MEPEPTPIIILTGKRRPHELMLLGFSILSGVAFLLGAPRPASMGSEMGGTWVDLWAASLAISGAVGLLGCYWKDNLRQGLLLERSGMLIGAAAVFGYAMQVYSYNGTKALFAGGFCLAWAFSNVARSLQIGKDLDSLRGARDGRGG